MSRFDPLAARTPLQLPLAPPAALLSILIPAYNAERYLPECLDALWQQRFDGLEVLVCDDGSQDSTAELLRNEPARWGGALRLLLHTANRGIGATRNELVRQARGRYLWFVDADDLVCAGAVARLRPLLEARVARRREPAAAHEFPDAIGFDFALLGAPACSARRRRRNAHRSSFAGRHDEPVRDASELLAGLLESGQLHPWSRIIDRDAWQGAPTFPDSRIAEDMATMPLVLLRCRSYFHVAEPLIAYRQHERSAMRTLAAADIDALSACSAALGAALRQEPLSTAARDAQADFATRTFRGACRQAAKAGLPLDGDRRQRLLDHLELAAGRRAAEQLQSLRRRRRWLDWLRLAAWLHAPALAALPRRLRRAGRSRSGP